MIDETKKLREENTRLTKELTEVKRLLDGIMEHAPEGITIADVPDVSIRMVSRFGREMIGRSMEEIENAPKEQRPKALGIFHADGVTPARSEELPLTRATLMGEVTINEEWVVERPDGAKLTVLCNAGPIRDETGSISGGVIVWRDVTELKRMQEEISRKELEEKSNRLQEVNAALKVLLKHRDDDRKDFEEALLTNIDNLILPYLKRMKTETLSGTQSALLEIVESHLRELTSEFGKTLALQYRVLTPTEMRVAALVREGKTSKEISEILCISEKTASFHRNNIRRKLGLRKAGANLRSHLLSLA